MNPPKALFAKLYPNEKKDSEHTPKLSAIFERMASVDFSCAVPTSVIIMPKFIKSTNATPMRIHTVAICWSRSSNF